MYMASSERDWALEEKHETQNQLPVGTSVRRKHLRWIIQVQPLQSIPGFLLAESVESHIQQKISSKP